MKKLEDLNLPNKIKYIVHCPTGNIGACEKHKNQLISLHGVLGCYIHFTPIDSNKPCPNCVNELKAKNEMS